VEGEQAVIQGKEEEKNKCDEVRETEKRSRKMQCEEWKVKLSRYRPGQALGVPGG
jgi:hypothetical protein